MNKKVIIKNPNNDVLASRVLEELIIALKSEVDCSLDAKIQKDYIKEEKCEINVWVEIVFAVSTGIAASVIYDCIKKVCERFTFRRKKTQLLITLDDGIEYSINIEGINQNNDYVNIEINLRK